MTRTLYTALNMVGVDRLKDTVKKRCVWQTMNMMSIDENYVETLCKKPTGNLGAKINLYRLLRR